MRKSVTSVKFCITAAKKKYKNNKEKEANWNTIFVILKIALWRHLSCSKFHITGLSIPLGQNTKQDATQNRHHLCPHPKPYALVAITETSAFNY